jgi:hypothetical protein
MDGGASFPVGKPWLTAEKPGDNHVFKLRDNFCFVHCGSHVSEKATVG